MSDQLSSTLIDTKQSQIDWLKNESLKTNHDLVMRGLEIKNLERRLESVTKAVLATAVLGLLSSGFLGSALFFGWFA